MLERVSTEELVKVYGPTRALAGVSITLEAGTTTVIAGPNGSGKSTLVALLSLLATPTRGVVRYGKDVAKPDSLDARRQVGVLAHAAMLYPDLTGRENLAFFASLYGVERARLEALIERFDLGKFVDRETRTYSRGQLQRVALARAILHSPSLLVLDEPSTGLDRTSTDALLGAVEAERARGAIVVVVTHDTALESALATRTVRLVRGRVEA